MAAWKWLNRFVKVDKLYIYITSLNSTVTTSYYPHYQALLLLFSILHMCKYLRQKKLKERKSLVQDCVHQWPPGCGLTRIQLLGRLLVHKYTLHGYWVYYYTCIICLACQKQPNYWIFVKPWMGLNFCQTMNGVATGAYQALPLLQFSVCNYSVCLSEKKRGRIWEGGKLATGYISL